MDETPAATRGMHRIVLYLALGAMALATFMLWGPVSRGLHEESVARWCTWSATVDGVSRVDLETAVTQCVDQALADPAYLTTLRASL